MAGDWIKFEHTTPDKPEVVKMAATLRIDQDAVVGKLLRVWVWADLNCLNGDGVGVTEAFIDRLTNRRGFAAAMRSVGWIAGADGNLQFTNFQRHNGASAKLRAAENRRKTDYRERSKTGQMSVICPEDRGTNAGQTPDENRGPEKRREEYNTPHSPPQAGGGNADAVKPARFRRAERLETLCAERDRIAAEMRDILRPGGCAYSVQPTGEKATRLESLRAAHAELEVRIQKHGTAA